MIFEVPRRAQEGPSTRLRTSREKSRATTTISSKRWCGPCMRRGMARFVADLESGKMIPEHPKRILVPVDFSPESAAALRYAMTLASRDTQIDVVHVWD